MKKVQAESPTNRNIKEAAQVPFCILLHSVEQFFQPGDLFVQHADLPVEPVPHNPRSVKDSAHVAVDGLG